MEIIPAIDLKDGACVRLYQGDFDQTTVYGDDPVAVARQWVAQGATRLHLVDLDGAKAGQPVNTDTIGAIVRAIDIPVQLGGGLRDEASIAAALALGVARVILGTAAVETPDLVTQVLEHTGPERLIIGVDARNGYVATAGWLADETVQATDLIAHMTRLGVQRFVYTDIARDGTLSEPNFDATAALVRPGGPAIIASGGVAHIEHLTRLAGMGIEATIVGRALYTGAFSLPAALETLKEQR